jgi:senataxin
VEISSVDAFQGREANIVIFSCVRATGSKGIGFLSDVRRMNVALTRSKHFLFVIANTRSITVNPYWRDLVEQAHMSEAVIQVPFFGSQQTNSFPDLSTLKAKPLPQKGPGATEYIRGYNHVGVVSQKNDSEGQQQSSPQPCDVAEQQVKRQTLETASKVKEDTMCRQ